jgi:hypothetical protein
MSLETQITSLVTAIGTDIKALRLADGDLSTLTTTAKSSLVAALNELKTLIGTGGGAAINDASTTSTTTTWSAQKSTAAIDAAVTALVASSPSTLNTLNELATALGNDPNYATTIATAMGNRIRFDAAQTLTTPQQAQACANIGVGDPAHNFVTDYTTAKA